ncbi:MAG: hypothetical protein M1834_004400 [Cirrosporium novae-zelandiae]|nr:MAG: hypothetical protein M1834_004400 [Cirrosporium novae-zelandiae]
MNTIKSTYYGWGALIMAGGGAYYFAKKSVNADRQARFEERQKKQAMIRALEASAGPSGIFTNGNHRDGDNAANPSSEASLDPAPTRHVPENEGQRVREKSKFEASEPYRSRKGDRLN